MNSSVPIPAPASRSLRIFAFDPSISAQFSTAGIGEITISVRWEHDLKPGPVGEYVAVVDADPASNTFYRFVDLNDPHLLAQSGLAPAETNPLFHQQMVYAVAMTTIGHFEQALGRVALWSSHRTPGGKDEQFVRQLRIYPHALRERNAYYSPVKKALLFGYFPVSIKDANNTPGTIVFSCLSHDIIAHEVTHALLDGVHPRFSERMNADVFAFHEAFADIVALFQHFTYPGVLRDQVSRARGDLAAENMLGQLAQQFGRSSGRSAALRDAIGGYDEEEKKWKPHVPDPRKLERTFESHERGSILVAAVFGAFLKVYRARTLDLYRIASEGTGVLRAGDILPDLTNRLADEASRTAAYLLQACIRAIDYCPPVGITFGDFLRAVVTADTEYNADDPLGFRLALVDSFRQWGIHPEGMRSMSIEALLWPSGHSLKGPVAAVDDSAVLKSLFEDIQEIGSVAQQSVTPRMRSKGPISLKRWDLETDRYETWEGIGANSAALWSWLIRGSGRTFAPILGLVIDGPNIPRTVYRSDGGGDETPAVEVHSVRRALRRTQRGEIVKDLVIEVTQRRRGYFDKDVQQAEDMAPPGAVPAKADFIYRAGCTALINPDTMEIRRVIRTPGTIADDRQLDRLRKYLVEGSEPQDSYFAARAGIDLDEPFAMLHRDEEA
jgi:hypothetical protein